MGPTLTLEGTHAAAIRALLVGRRAWLSTRVLSRRGHRPVTLEQLEAAGLAERWLRDRQGKPFTVEFWTLTALGAYRLGMDIDEEEEEVPRWIEGRAEGPIRVKQSPGERRLTCPQLVPDRRPPPEYVLDLETGETTKDPGEAATLMNVPVKVDPRLSKGPSGTDRRRTRAKKGKSTQGR